MRKNSSILVALAACALAAGTALVATPAQAASGPTVRVVANHLNNPRGLAMSAGGQLYVAEAGRGSTSHCQTDPTGSVNCVGLTGSIDRVNTHGVTRLVTGLISIAGGDGSGAEGMVAVSTDAGHVYGQFGTNTSGIPPAGFPNFLLTAAHAYLGQFGVVSGSSFSTIAGVGDFDFAWTAKHPNLVPGQFPDSNPNGVLTIGGERYVADAGANTLDEVEANGKVRILAFLPAPKGSITDTVPTCVTQGPDGALYVGELLGGTYAPGGARVWRIVVSGGHVVSKSIWARGLTTIQGCGFDAWGNFYATEFQVGGLNEDPTGSPLGAVVKIAPSGHRTTLGLGHLFWPSGLATGADGSIYVSNCSIVPGAGFGPCPVGGEVVRIS
jgi:hypothetical protein